MTEWKLTRVKYGTEEYKFKEGDEVTIGRAVSSTIALSSIVISRKHCVINFYPGKILITDTGSANGVYVDTLKIPQNKPYEIKDSDIIGIGWTLGAVVADKLNDNERFMFRLSRMGSPPPIIKRLKYQSDNEFEEIEEKFAAVNMGKALPQKPPPPMEDIEEKLAAIDMGKTLPQKSPSPILHSKVSLKRKAVENINDLTKENKRCHIVTLKDDIVNLLSESDQETVVTERNGIVQNVKLEPITEDNHVDLPQGQIKTENEYLGLEAFHVKQEYMGYDDEPIKIDSDSDSESENWYLRLSQNSPGKPFSKMAKTKTEEKKDNSSYSQIDDNFCIDLCYTDNEAEEEEFMDDIITILPPPEERFETPVADTSSKPVEPMSDIEEFENDIISLNGPILPKHLEQPAPSTDELDGYKEPVNRSMVIDMETTKIAPESTVKKTQIIEPKHQTYRGRSKNKSEKKSRSSSSIKHGKIKKHSSKKLISNSQKEERKKKLKEIATKTKEAEKQSLDSSTSATNKTLPNVKITNSNRGAFLTSTVDMLKSSKKKEAKDKKLREKSVELKSPENSKGSVSPEKNQKSQPSKSHSSKKHENETSKAKHDSSKRRSSHSKVHNSKSAKAKDPHIPPKDPKPLTETNVPHPRKSILKDSNSIQKPPEKILKKIRFSEAAPKIIEFEIEPGNKLKKTSLAKTSLVNIPQLPKFSLEKFTLIKILRWNPNWLEEQIKLDEPPPILGHQSNPPMSMLHSFTNHAQYVRLVGDLLLIEVWENLTLAYMKLREQNHALEMRIETLPPMPSQEMGYELLNLSVNISLPSHDAKKVPRIGDILLIKFGPEKIQRFFYVHNVRCLPSPPNNIHSFFSIGVHATFTEKMRSLRIGEVISACTLAYIGKELNIFEALNYLAKSPLAEAILCPEPKHFQTSHAPPNCLALKWTDTLNPSQRAAVAASVAAALGNRPTIQMVQGPPGTGKSSVICSVVMSYFYSGTSRIPNRGKILICATSNAAVDELVLRLLNIRQTLPKMERFKMVRVGREEAMVARARDVSSQHLVQRDARLHAAEPAPHAHAEEIAHLEAKINMWRTAMQDAKDPVRTAYCHGRIAELQKKIVLVRKACGGVSAGGRAEHLMAAERRIIEGADIIVTTLGSTYSYKMKGLKRRIALCIIDEAGQAIEPETLLPLTLDVTNLTLIGDPQQLPGYICSQRAKKLGLGDSLFSRLTSNCEQWRVNPVALLNEQYRMHADIADYPNRAFYGGVVKTSVPERPLLPIPPYTILSISSGDKGQGASGANEMEAWGVSRLVHALRGELASRSLSLAVITPYHAQKDLIKRNLKILQGPSESPIEVNTVDSFQGQERDVVVVSLVRSQGVGFLTDVGRMNVMLTRARQALVICLNPHAMMKNNQWRTLLDDAQRRKMWRILPNDMCQPVYPGQAPAGDILRYIKSPK